MTNINVTNLRKNLSKTIDAVIKYGETINVSTKRGNVYIISEEEYNDLIATIELSSNSELHDKIIAGKNETIDECINVD